MHIHRCDATAQGQEQAHHRAVKDDQELLFCNHHWYLYRDILMATGWWRQDLRALTTVGAE